MRPILGSIVMFLMVGSAANARAQKPNTLSQQEISDGWLLLFDGETDYGWKSRTGEWTVNGGTLQSPSSGGTLSTTTEFADFEFTCEYQEEGEATAAVRFNCPAAGDIPPNGTIQLFRSRPGRRPDAKWKSVRLTAEGDRVRSRGGALSALRGGGPSRGVIALYARGNGAVRFRNIKLRPLGVKSAFNGKDLTGWKVIEGHKSVFSVTPEGWLNIKDGNGEIQSVGTWGDFVLQLEIISNGDHLNSGVFFRAEPGQFWLGYEAQIRNQWEGEDRTKPVDFGTGAIYNRQKARKVVSSDREWFTMTVTAVGNHLATWVNGTQVTDFTDTRPENQLNARAGLRTAPGVLSLQGHDPTTDLSFRNIRIVELPANR